MREMSFTENFVLISKTGFCPNLVGLQWAIFGFYIHKMLIVISYID